MLDDFKQNARQTMQNLTPQQRAALGYVVMVIGVIFVLFILFFAGRTDPTETEGDVAPPFSSAFISKDDIPYRISDDTVVENLIKEDLAHFARERYPDSYGVDGTIIVEFFLTESARRGGSVTAFDGRFDRSKNDIEVSVELLRNSRIKTTITDKQTGDSMSDNLPSNSPQNQLIAALPITEDRYSIQYVAPDGVAIQAYVRDPEIFEEGRARIAEEIGQDATDQITTSISFPTANFEEEEFIQ